MRAYQSLDRNTAPVIRDVIARMPAKGEVRIEIAACGLNFADLLMAQGRYQDTPPVPFTLGLEFAGVVAELGEGVTLLPVGARVAVVAGQGGLAGVSPPAEHLSRQLRFRR